MVLFAAAALPISASGGIVKEARTQAALSTVSEAGLAFVLVLPRACTAGNHVTCNKFVEFWDQLAEASPLDGILWRVRCSGSGDPYMELCQMADAWQRQHPQLGGGDPLVYEWSGHGAWWQYRGERSFNALTAFVAAKVNSAMSSQGGVHPEAPGNSYAPVSDVCMMEAFREAHAQQDVPAAASALGYSALRAALRPADVSPVPLYDGPLHNTTMPISASGQEVFVSTGAMQWPAHLGLTSSAFHVLPSLVTEAEVREIRSLVEGVDRHSKSAGAGGATSSREQVSFDTDPDSVDGMASHELFVVHGAGGASATKGGDADPQQRAARRALRARLRRTMDSIVDERITPFVRAAYPAVCNRSDAPDRACTACSSLVRRYREGERRGHGSHYDAEVRLAPSVEPCTMHTPRIARGRARMVLMMRTHCAQSVPSRASPPPA